MNTLLARQFQIKELTDERLKKLHVLEKRIGRNYVPYEINKIGELPKHGAISDETQKKLNRLIWPVHDKILKEMVRIADGGGLPPFEIDLIQKADWAIRALNLDFTDYENQKTSIFDKL